MTVSPSAEATEKFLRLAHGDEVNELRMAGCEIRRVVLMAESDGLA